MNFLQKYNKDGNAVNIYRTKHYFVEQQIYLDHMPDGRSILYSNDAYYLRSRKLDKHLENMFRNRKNINGNRVYVGISKRKYCY